MVGGGMGVMLKRIGLKRRLSTRSQFLPKRGPDEKKALQ